MDVKFDSWREEYKLATPLNKEVNENILTYKSKQEDGADDRIKSTICTLNLI
jgi:hypothetical protein